jgi:hypothetical protein
MRRRDGLASRLCRTSTHPLILRGCRDISTLMIKSVRKINFVHMTRFGWAVEGVAR